MARNRAFAFAWFMAFTDLVKDWITDLFFCRECSLEDLRAGVLDPVPEEPPEGSENNRCGSAATQSKDGSHL